MTRFRDPNVLKFNLQFYFFTSFFDAWNNKIWSKLRQIKNRQKEARELSYFLKNNNLSRGSVIQNCYMLSDLHICGATKIKRDSSSVYDFRKEDWIKQGLHISFILIIIDADVTVSQEQEALKVKHHWLHDMTLFSLMCTVPSISNDQWPRSS
jgi:hypothetical protein